MTGFGWAFLVALVFYLIVTIVLVRTWPWFTPLGVASWVAFIGLSAAAILSQPQRRR